MIDNLERGRGRSTAPLIQRLDHVRIAFKDKKYSEILSNPVNMSLVIFLGVRSVVLRFIPHVNEVYFLRKQFSAESFCPYESRIKFAIYLDYSKEIEEFVKNRCLEDPTHFQESYARKVQARFRVGMNACALIEGGRIASMFFITRLECIADPVPYRYVPYSNEVVITDIYTMQEHRRKGLYSLLLRHTVNYFADSGNIGIVMWIMRHNRATIQAQIRQGFCDIFLSVRQLTWLGLEWIAINPTSRTLKDL